jgi:hypothetical protein
MKNELNESYPLLPLWVPYFSERFILVSATVSFERMHRRLRAKT